MTAVSIAYALHVRQLAAPLLVVGVLVFAVWRCRGNRTLRDLADSLAEVIGR